METKKLLVTVKSIIDAHKEFKEAYNSRLAFDFNVLNFFKVGENKTSEIFAFFLNPKESHGQGKAFLYEFVSLLSEEQVNSLLFKEEILSLLDQEDIIKDIKVLPEHRIDNDRRIDLYIEIRDFVLAIENKIWAKDQLNQLKDYSEYLEEKSKGKYLLFYLTPYKTDPNPHSISSKLKEKLESENKLKQISYKTDVSDLITRWLGVCEADNVTWFLRQFQSHLKTKFGWNQTLNIQKKMEKLVLDHQEEVKELVQTYKRIEEQLLNIIYGIAKAYKDKALSMQNTLAFEKIGPFTYYVEDFKLDRVVYKIGISEGNNKVWIQIYKDDLNLFSNHYFEKGTSKTFEKKFSVVDLHNHEEIELRGDSKDNPKDVFEKQLHLALKVLEG